MLNKLTGWADYFGITASTLCLMHCLGTPFLLLTFPLIGVEWGDEDAFHHVLAMMVTLPALLGLIPGFLAHRQPWIPLAGMTGLVCLLMGILVIGPYYGEAAEVVLAVAGGVMLLAAHVGNRRECRCC